MSLIIALYLYFRVAHRDRPEIAETNTTLFPFEHNALLSNPNIYFN